MALVGEEQLPNVFGNTQSKSNRRHREGPEKRTRVIDRLDEDYSNEDPMIQIEQEESQHHGRSLEGEDDVDVWTWEYSLPSNLVANVKAIVRSIWNNMSIRLKEESVQLNESQYSMMASAVAAFVRRYVEQMIKLRKSSGTIRRRNPEDGDWNFSMNAARLVECPESVLEASERRIRQLMAERNNEKEKQPTRKYSPRKKL
eukprot:TRINITY_DN13458_c0_g1_i1.p1 TRINITY_DN13458_c0_g1~~TRINITY_DN13458_c0_g1_i1.p1  ORF type:complete len:201 (-),score=40.83 TRINITY_DN13458_c0_g1_i1:25-627(-)